MKAARQVLRMRHQITWHERIWEGEKKRKEIEMMTLVLRLSGLETSPSTLLVTFLACILFKYAWIF